MCRLKPSMLIIFKSGRTTYLKFFNYFLDKGSFDCYELKSFNGKGGGKLKDMPFFYENKLSKLKKEDGMKKLLLVALAILLAVPAVGHAAVASRMWDLTIQGYVAAIVQFSDQNDKLATQGTPARRTGTGEVEANEFSNLATNVDSRIGFLAKGPDTWGAKTSAYMEWDFAGFASGTNGAARIRHTWINWDWAKDSIRFGNQGSIWRDVGMGLPPGASSVIAEPVVWGGPRDFELRWTHRYSKQFETKFAAVWGGLDKFFESGTANEYTHTNLPFLAGQARWNSDSCGKVGNMNLAVVANAVVGQYAKMRDTGVAGHNRYSQTHGYGWLANAAVQVPIIPEKQGNKAGSIVLFGYLEAVQGLPIGVNPGSYTRSIYTSPSGPVYASADDYSYPRGYLAQATGYFYMANSVFVNLTYGLNKYEGSTRALRAGNTVDRKQFYLVSLAYQPNPALYMGIEYARYVADYNHGSAYPAGQSQGVSNAIRFGAYYYF